MKKALLGLLPLAALAALAVAGSALLPQSASSNSPIGSKILAHKLAVELGKEQPRGKEMPVSSGIMYTLYDAAGILQRRAAQNPGAMRALGGGNHGISNPKTEGCQNVFHGHGMTNTRVNQDCSLRRQAEETIQINPTNEKNIIAGQNDSRIGFNHCGYDWSFDGGKRWGDQVPPFWQFVLLDGHTADACSDPTLAWDSQGNAYAGGVFFDLNSGANAVLAMKSNAPNGGSFYHSPDPTGGFQEYRDTPAGVIANDDGNEFANDKELMTADSNPSSPKHDNVYMTWTRFNAAEPQPDLLQPVDGRRRHLVRSDRDQRLRPEHLPAGRRRLQRRPGLRPGRRARRHDLRLVLERERARDRHRAGAERDLPGQCRLQQPGELDGSDEGRRHDLDAARRARRARTAARTGSAYRRTATALPTRRP